MTSTSTTYCCENCNKSYILKHNYDRHKSVCSFFYKSHKEIADEIDNEGPIPSAREMYSLIQAMALRIEKLEKENNNLKQRENRQSNPLAILKNIKPDLVFSQWIQKYVLPDVHQHLQVVFDYSLFDGIKELLQQVFGDVRHQTCIPVQYYPNKQNNVYVYETGDNGKESWRLSTNAQLETYIRMITNEFHRQFGIWRENNQELMDGDQELFAAYYTKILGDDNLCKRKMKRLLSECLTNIHHSE